MITREAHTAAHGDRYQFAEDWTGPCFRYGYRNRPYAMAHQPKGYIIGSVDEDARDVAKGVRWGTIEYPFQLAEHEVYAFELVELTTGEEL